MCGNKKECHKQKQRGFVSMTQVDHYLTVLPKQYWQENAIILFAKGSGWGKAQRVRWYGRHSPVNLYSESITLIFLMFFPYYPLMTAVSKHFFLFLWLNHNVLLLRTVALTFVVFLPTWFEGRPDYALCCIRLST